jgi:choline dehydrogenase
MAESVSAFDYVVVGGGTAGCVLANRLSADPGVRVCLLEAGGKDDWIWFHIPIGYLYAMGNPRADWCFQTEPEPGLNGRALNYPRGKVLGGCSAINGMIYMRGQAADYDHWRQLGNVGWSWTDVLPYFRRSQDQARGADEHHGAGGEWRVEEMRLTWEILDAFREAAAQAGVPKIDDFNRGDNEGCGYFQVNQRRGLRWSAATAFLKPALGRPNLEVITGAHATRLRFQGKRCVGVEFVEGGATRFVGAAGEVVLAAGAVKTPQLLLLSGVGPAEHLSEHGIELVHDAPGVGGNLQDHLQIRCIYKVSGVRTLNERAGSLIGKALMGAEYALFRRGPLTMAPSQLGGFAKSDPSRATPNLQYHIQPLSLEKFGEPLHPFPAFTASVCNLRPESRGAIRLKSADPAAAPAIRPNYLDDPADRLVAAQAIRLTRRIVAQPALAKYRPEEFRPGPQYQSDEELAKAAGDFSTTIFHPVGTAKMGRDPAAVVDDRLWAHGLEGLRIADASVMPTITSGNTNSPVVMIAEKASDMMKEDRKSGRLAA